jgi:molybdenum cofactor cytidylyltransferase
MIAAVLLAAGSARRFDGSQKLLAPIPDGRDDVPLVRRAAGAHVVGGLTRIVVVLGREATQVRESLNGLDVQFVINAAYASGLSSSVRAGVSEAARLWPAAPALLIALGDQPLAGTNIIETLIATLGDDPPGEDPPKIIAPRFRGEAGNPVLFVRELLPELLEVSGDRGARVVVEREPARVRYVDFDCAAPPDVDTVSDLAALTGGLRYR